MRSVSLKTLILVTFIVAIAIFAGKKWWNKDQVVVYTAKSIITMEDPQPRVEAVAVQHGKIIGLGSKEALLKQFADRQLTLDERFNDKVIMPGFIENHLHPAMAAMLLPLNWITPFDWNLPGKTVTGVQDEQAYRQALAEAVKTFYQSHDDSELFITWGYHHYFHGDISREIIDQIAPDKPVMVWHRSFHEVFFNSTALKRVEFSEQELADAHQVNIDKGHFYETGLLLALGKFRDDIMQTGRFMDGLNQVVDVTRHGGITTIADMAAGMFDMDMEWLAFNWVLDDKDTPFRTRLIPMSDKLGEAAGSEAAIAKQAEWIDKGNEKLKFVKQIKLLADGAFYSQLMQMREPGYLDGHHGEWITEPEQLHKLAKAYWQADYQLHIHTNGDLGAEEVLKVIADLQQQMPRKDHRTTLHHLGYVGADQVKQIADLGIIVSANPYYLYTLGEKYSEIGLGPERAQNIFRGRDLLNQGISVSLHSDFSMAPAHPLLLAWVAVNRLGANGTLLSPEQKLTVHEAMRAITIDAAFAIRMENEVGSLKVGKKADFTVLEQDPYQVEPIQLKDIPIWGTVFEGKVFELER